MMSLTEPCFLPGPIAAGQAGHTNAAPFCPGER